MMFFWMMCVRSLGDGWVERQTDDARIDVFILIFLFFLNFSFHFHKIHNRCSLQGEFLHDDVISLQDISQVNLSRTNLVFDYIYKLVYIYYEAPANGGVSRAVITIRS